MQASNRSIVMGEDGQIGVVDQAAQSAGEHRKHLPVRLENGRMIWIPEDLFEERAEGGYYLPLRREHISMYAGDWAESQTENMILIPIIQEQLRVGKRVEESKVRVTKRVHTEEKPVDVSGFVEEVHVERVEVNQLAEKWQEPHLEGNTLVIPIYEERLVVEKRLVLKEEIRVTKTRTETRGSETVTLRREEAVIESIDSPKQENQGDRR